MRLNSCEICLNTKLQREFMKLKDLIKSLFLAIVFMTSLAHAEIGSISFEEIVHRSDIIIEGEVIEQKNQTTQEGGFKFFRLAHLRVDKVYKGDVKEGETIEIYNGSDFFYDMSVLDINQRYIICLKHHETGFRDAYYGRGQWLIDNREGAAFVRDTLKEEKTNYDEFVTKLNDIIAKDKEPQKKRLGWF
jgi:hypothetical protein